MVDPAPPLGGLSPNAFLRGYWQKRPLLVRQAIPGFKGLIEKRALFALAENDEAESRLVQRSPDWRVTPGPFSRSALSRLPASNWTLLLNDLNLYSDAADAILKLFSFASWARVDDVMVSYAADGGGVGAHVDSYDVFLLQGPGRRRWRLMPPNRKPFKLVEGAPLKLIANFRPVKEMTLDCGDMLYVPPGWGHEGIAIGPCQTYSIGFRAPGAVELSTAFLDYLHERGFHERSFRDPDRKVAIHAAKIDEHLIRHAADALARIRWNTADVTDFLGRYLSEPKQHVTFDPPPRPWSRADFLRRLRTAKVRLDPRTRMLTKGLRVYLNGTSFEMGDRGPGGLQELADCREADGEHFARAPTKDLIYDWYRQGFLLLETQR